MKSALLRAQYKGVTFARFQRGFLHPGNERRWANIVETLRKATPPERWPPDLDTTIRNILVNFAWAAAVTPKPTGGVQYVDQETRESAEKFLLALERAQMAWAKFEAAYGLTEVSANLGPGIADRQALAKSIRDAPVNRGGRPDQRQFDYLMAMCRRAVFEPLTGRRASRSMSDPFARFADHVTQLATAAQKQLGADLLSLPVEAEAFRKRLSRSGQRTKP